jgi:CheY-like chemotaxis protein
MTSSVIRVLVVDDDEDARVLLVRALRRTGLDLEIATAVDGRDALDQISIAPPDVVITDVSMPRVDGLALCAALRAVRQTATIPLIIVSALADETHRQRGLAAGADAYLTKPCDGTTLATWLRQLLGDVGN